MYDVRKVETSHLPLKNTVSMLASDYGTLPLLAGVPSYPFSKSIKDSTIMLTHAVYGWNHDRYGRSVIPCASVAFRKRR